MNHWLHAQLVGTSLLLQFDPLFLLVSLFSLQTLGDMGFIELVELIGEGVYVGLLWTL